MRLKSRKRRRKIAVALLDKKQLLPTLQDFCINVITENISDVDALGLVVIISDEDLSNFGKESVIE